MTKLHSILLFLLLSILISCSEENEIQQFSISDFTPKNVLTGDRVVIYGENFPNDKRNTIVTVGEIEYAVESVSPDSIVIFVPEKAITGNIRVVNGKKDALSQDVLRIEQFEIIDFIPNVGYSGDLISISGNGFTIDKNLLRVEFNGILAEIQQSNENTILAIVPEGATTGRISVQYNNVKVSSAYDFRVVDKPDDSGGGGDKDDAKRFLPIANNTYLFQNWNFDDNNRRIGQPVNDTSWVVDNVSFKGFQAVRVNSRLVNLPQQQVTQKHYRTSGKQFYSDGLSEIDIPPIFAEELSDEIDWVVMLDLDRTSWEVYRINNINFQLPLQGQTINVRINSNGNARRIGDQRKETLAGKELDIIEVEYTFNTQITITIGFFPLVQEVTSVSRYWFAEGHGIVREINFTADESGQNPFGDFTEPGERVLFRIYE